jgi:purine-binding chemotaxis protein CheW
MQRQLITFAIENQAFGIDIAVIREIRAWSPVTRIPGVPDHVVGVANLRGAIIPVFDVAIRFGWPGTVASERHAIIVVEVAGQSSGILAESVSDLVEIDGAALQPPPALQDARIAGFIEGIAPGPDGALIMVLRLDVLLGAGSDSGLALPRLRKG